MKCQQNYYYLYIFIIISYLDYNENHSITHLTIKLQFSYYCLHVCILVLKQNDDLESFNELCTILFTSHQLLAKLLRTKELQEY